MSEQALVRHHAPPPAPGPAPGPGAQGPTPGPGAQGHQTALHRAATVGHHDTMSALVQGGCAMDLQDRDGNTALHEVAWHGFCQCVKLLVKAGADVHIKNKAGNTALHLACQNSHTQTTRVLLLGGSGPDTKNHVGDTCLHVAARYNNLTIVKILLGTLCSVSKTNQAGDTALHLAAALNHKKTVQLLLEAGTDGNVKNCAGKTALDKARDNNHRDVALLLARAPQVHRFLRGRTVRKRREQLKAERRTQSVTRMEILPKKEQEVSSLEEEEEEEDSPSSDQLVSRTALVRTGLHSRHRHRFRELALEDDSSRRGENDLVSEKKKRKDEPSPYDGEIPHPLEGRAYQLYTLYRDKDGNIRQRPAPNGCHCKPLVRKLEGQLKAAQEEMKLQVLRVQEQVGCRLGKMDRRTRHQIQVLDLLNQERGDAERQDMLYRIDHMAARSREDADRRQAALTRQLEALCIMSPDDPPAACNPRRYYKLLPSPSVDQSLADESLPLLSSVASDESSGSLATYVNVLPPSPRRRRYSGPYGLAGGEEEEEAREYFAAASGKYFEVKVERSPSDYENTAIFPLPLVSSADPFWHPPKRQDRPVTMVGLGAGEGHQYPMMGLAGEGQQYPIVGLAGEGQYPIVGLPEGEGQQYPSSSLSSSHTSAATSSDWSHRNRLRKRILAHRHGGGRGRRRPGGDHHHHTGTLKFFVDRAGGPSSSSSSTEPAFVRERNNLHAMEVTQRFFETVSTQLERWYERKVLEARQQAEFVGREDRERLLQRIISLEEELRLLRTNGESAES